MRAAVLLAALAGQMPLVVTPAAASCLAAAALCACGRVAQLERECSTLRAKLAQGRASGNGRGQAGAAGADSEGPGGLEANGDDAGRRLGKRQRAQAEPQPQPQPEPEPGAGGQQQQGRTKLSVRGLSKGTREADLHALFSQHGAISSIVQKGRFAFVDFATTEAAASALKLDGVELQQRTLRVGWSVPKSAAERAADAAWERQNRGSQRVKLRPPRRPPAASAEPRPAPAFGATDGAEQLAVVGGSNGRGSGRAGKDADHAAVGELVAYTRDGLRVGKKLYPFPQ